MRGRVVVEEQVINEKVRGSGVRLVTVAGEVDLATSPSLAERLRRGAGSDADVQVVDLLGVTFIDSTGLGVLIGALKRQREAGGSIRLVIDNPRILRIFEVTGLIEVFPIFASLDQALDA